MWSTQGSEIMKKIFNCAGVDMGSKELAKKVRMLSEKSALIADENSF